MDEDKRRLEEISPIQETSPPEAEPVPEMTPEQWRMFIAFKDTVEKRLGELMSKEEIRDMMTDVMAEALQDRPSAARVAEMIEEMRANEARRIDTAIESVKMHGEQWKAQNDEIANRLARENARDKQNMQDLFSHEVAELRASTTRTIEEARKSAESGIERANAVVNQYTGQVQFLQQLVQRFDERTNTLAKRQDEQAEEIARIDARQTDAELRFTTWMVPFEGESGFIALVKRQSKFVDSQQRLVEMRQKAFGAVAQAFTNPKFLMALGVGSGGSVVGGLIAKIFGLF